LKGIAVTEMVLDLVEIKKSAQIDWNSNWELKETLASYGDGKHIDKIAHKIAKEVADKIDCTKCANCCRVMSPQITSTEVETILEVYEGDENTFFKTLKPIGHDFEFCSRPCQFLEEDRCKVYSHRPYDCESYPHLHQPNFIEGMDGFIENYGVCPIVFNTLNRLRDEITSISIK
jgi:Fe-S-cluster containining protein